MRTVVVRFWGDVNNPRELARVDFDATGPATIINAEPRIKRQLEEGIWDMSGAVPVFRRLEEGARFAKALLWQYRGGYVRAQELEPGETPPRTI